MMKRLMSSLLMVGVMVACLGCGVLFDGKPITVTINDNPVRLSQVLEMAAGLISPEAADNEAALDQLTAIVGVDCVALTQNLAEARDLALTIVEQLQAAFGGSRDPDQVLTSYEIVLEVDN
jgi:hypothetical protein